MGGILYICMCILAKLHEVLAHHLFCSPHPPFLSLSPCSTLLISLTSLTSSHLSHLIQPFSSLSPHSTLLISLTSPNPSHLSTACRGYLRWGRTQLHLEGSSGHIRDTLLLQPSQCCWLIDYLQLIHRFELLHMSCIDRCSTHEWHLRACHPSLCTEVQLFLKVKMAVVSCTAGCTSNPCPNTRTNQYTAGIQK